MNPDLFIAFAILVFGLGVGFSIGHVQGEQSVVTRADDDARPCRCVGGKFYYVVPASEYADWIVKLRQSGYRGIPHASAPQAADGRAT